SISIFKYFSPIALSNFAARSLILKKTNIIGLIVADLENPFFSRLTRGVIQTAENDNYNIITCESKFDNAIGEKYLNMLMDRGVDGLILANLNISNNTVNELHRRRIPFVLLTCKVDMPDVNYVISDDFQGGKLAIEYIIKLGHKNIAFLKGPDVSSANARLSAYKEEMKKNNLDIRDYFISEAVSDQGNGRKITLKLLKTHKDITAIIAVNDFVAIGALEAIQELGLSVPDDVSIIGYDDINITKLLRVPLTTIHYPKYTCGVIATKMLLNILNNESSEIRTKVTLKNKLIIRKSCAQIN
ncbi:MAG: substrate-binding domain-containing protein, partial [Actinobacteria bacterium]|nr:substrate-binding domain-containing protein [Actinomycetota bacterium]